jgi:AcrR family transcriptional regulator
MVVGMDAEKRSRNDWVVAGLASLGEVGVDKVRVDRIAATLGVTKGSFYWHFKDRDELLAAMVDGWETRNTESVISRVDASGLDPRARALKLWEMTASGPGIQAELAIRDWARRSDTVAASVQKVDDRRLRYLESLLAELDVPQLEIPARSLLIYSLHLGGYLIATTRPTRTRRKVVADALDMLLRPI